MDPSLLVDDGQTQPAHSDSQTAVLDASFSHSPTGNKLFPNKRVLEVPDPSYKLTDAFSNASKSVSQEISGDCLKPLPSSHDMPQHSSHISEPERVHHYFGSSTPTLPFLAKSPRDFSQFYVDHQPSLCFSHIQDNSTPQTFRATSPISKSSTEQGVIMTLSRSEHNNGTHLLTSVSHKLDGVKADTAPVSDLYIFESETQDFSLSPGIDYPEMKYPNTPSLSQTGTDYETHFPMCDSPELVRQFHHDCVDSESSAVSQQTGTGPPAADGRDGDQMPGNYMTSGKAEVSNLTPQAWQSGSPVELWMDASQYLGGEDPVDRGLLDKMVQSESEGGLSGDIKVSGYDPEKSDRIGWSSNDTRGLWAPVERWSSVDSWASALSDWTGIISAPAEDFTTVFTEIGTEIEALTQVLVDVNTLIDKTGEPAEVTLEGRDKETSGREPAVRSHTQTPMGIQDKPLEVQTVAESPGHSGQRSLSCSMTKIARLSPSPEPQKREGIQSENLCGPGSITPGEKEPERSQSNQVECFSRTGVEHSSIGSSGATPACPRGHHVDVMAVPPPEGSSVILGETTTSRSQFGEDAAEEESDIYNTNEKELVILQITEDPDLDLQNSPEVPIGTRLRDVREEHCINERALVTEQEHKRICGQAETSEFDPNKTSLHSKSNVHGVDIHPDLDVCARTNVSFDILPHVGSKCQVEPQQESPKFIMPLTSLSVSSSSICGTRNSLEGGLVCTKRSVSDNTGHSCSQIGPCVLRPTFVKISDQSSLEDKEKQLTEPKEHKIDTADKSPPDGQKEQLDYYSGDPTESFVINRISEFHRELLNQGGHHADACIVSKKARVACIILDLNDPFVSRPRKTITSVDQLGQNMPHKTHKSNSECRTRPKKDKPTYHHHHGVQTSKKQEGSSHHVPAQPVCKLQDSHPLRGENHAGHATPRFGLEAKEAKLVIGSGAVPESVSEKSHSKKKKKNTPNAMAVKSAEDVLVEVENVIKQKTAKGRIDMFEAKLGAKAGKDKKDGHQAEGAAKKAKQPEAKVSKVDKPPQVPVQMLKNFTSPLSDDAVKRPRLSEDKFGKTVLESKLIQPDVSKQAKTEEPKVDIGAMRMKGYSDTVKQTTITPKEDMKVVQPIQAVSVSGDPQSLCLWCQFACVFTDCTTTWSRDGTVLAENKRSAGDESRVSLIISNASHKHLGKYQCRLSTSHGSLTVDYLLTYEVLSEIVIPASPKNASSEPAVEVSEEEGVQCSRLIFREDFLSDKYFEENHPVTIVTEKVHFGEGMHRRAFRTKLQAGLVPLLLPGVSGVLKVHNAISYGTRNNEELIQKNFNLAVEECQVQNTAREYIKAYTAAAQGVEAFGEVPDIIPIYLVHRPSSNIPYATLEEELIGDFVKYSVKDGKEINLMRRDSEAGQKCCAFQHWVYHKTEGNLLVTDMQGVGMKLTDVGIATCKKGYKGFKGNCATSFIDQFKVLHQCNRYCEILGLQSLQPKPKKPSSGAKPKPQPGAAPKKKIFGPTFKGTS
ncbi:alpha-protein kinase 2 [Thalassophryne amazonica]|uniref:alpha-protein kinase 2 n=1 Tax=Thalassophryne amazonica TaxID=390379 RepID=UPI0014710119|nr:alpha-protein kinase 2 [Thalassophryne amazonica]